MKKHIFVLLAIITVVVVICWAGVKTIYGIGHVIARHQATKAQHVTNWDFTTNNDKQLETFTTKALHQYNVPGVAIAVIENGTTVYQKGFGVAKNDNFNNPLVTPETLFQVASISKPVSAWGIMKLVELKQIDLDTAVDPHYLKRWSFPPEADSTRVSGVTVRRLLSHTACTSVSGFSGFEWNDPNAQTTVLEMLQEGARDSGNETVGTFLCNPGSEFHYSGGGIGILELMLEDMTGQSFSEYMDKTILKPLGMKHATFDHHVATGILMNNASSSGNTIAYPHTLEGEIRNPRIFSTLAAAGLWTSVADLAIWASSILNTSTDGKIIGRGVLSPHTIQEMLQQQPNTQFGLGYELAYYDEGGGDDTSSPMVAFHTGHNLPGYSSLVAMVPGSKNNGGLVVLTNGEQGHYITGLLFCDWSSWIVRQEQTRLQMCVDFRYKQLLPKLQWLSLAFVVVALVIMVVLFYILIYKGRMNNNNPGTNSNANTADVGLLQEEEASLSDDEDENETAIMSLAAPLLDDQTNEEQDSSDRCNDSSGA